VEQSADEEDEFEHGVLRCVCPWPPLRAWAPNPMASKSPDRVMPTHSESSCSDYKSGGTIWAVLGADARAADPRTWLQDRTTPRTTTRAPRSARTYRRRRSLRQPAYASFCAAPDEHGNARTGSSAKYPDRQFGVDRAESPGVWGSTVVAGYVGRVRRGPRPATGFSFRFLPSAR
jgi:hypothetical protein